MYPPPPTPALHPGKLLGTPNRTSNLVPRPLYLKEMANLTLVYGMPLLPADEVASVSEAPIDLKNGNQAHVTMHILEGSREQIEAQLRHSIDAFFDFYPEI